MDDAQLLRRYAEDGSEPAFAELVARHLNLVHTAAMRQVGGDFHRASDVTQIVFIQLARKAASLTSHSALTGWLYTSTFYAAAQAMRTERRREAREKEAHIMNELTYSPEVLGEWAQLQPVLDSVMHELSERDRETILWRFFDAHPMAVIGARLGVSENTAQKRVDRALDKMRESFTKRGVASSTAALASMLANQAVIAAPAGLAESVTAGALASAAGAGSSAFTLGQILNAAKASVGIPGIIWVGGILGVFGIGTAAYELRTAQRAQASVAAATQEYQSEMERFRTLELSTHEADRNQAKSAATVSAKALDPFAAGRKFLARFPLARALLADEGMSEAARINAPFFRMEHLTPVQIEQFKTLIATTWVANVVVTPTDLAAGVMEPTEDQIRQLLGDHVAQRYENYLQSQYAYQFTNQVAAALAAAGMPLSSDQTDELAQVVETNSSFYENNATMDKNTVSFSNFAASVDWNGVGTQAKAVLSPAQWEAAQGTLLGSQVLGAFIQARRQKNP